MWLSINTLSVDQVHKKQSAGQDREIPDLAKFEKNDTIYSSIILTFHQPRVLLLFSSIYEFKFTSFLILAISKPGDSYKLLQRQKVQARGNKTIAGTKTNKNNAV